MAAPTRYRLVLDIEAQNDLGEPPDEDIQEILAKGTEGYSGDYGNEIKVLGVLEIHKNPR